MPFAKDRDDTVRLGAFKGRFGENITGRYIDHLVETFPSPVQHYDQVLCTVLYCTVLCCAVLYCAVLYCAVLHSPTTWRLPSLVMARAVLIWHMYWPSSLRSTSRMCRFHTLCPSCDTPIRGFLGGGGVNKIKR